MHPSKIEQINVTVGVRVQALTPEPEATARTDHANGIPIQVIQLHGAVAVAITV